jgi:general secretion pathway protein K
MLFPIGTKNLRVSFSRGVALISVLCLIAFLTAIATAVATRAVTQHRATSRLAQAIELETLADSAIRIVLLRYVSPLPRAPRWPIGAPQALALVGTVVEVRLERESSRLDLNFSTEEQLLATLAAQDWKMGDADSMAARIADWRDADDVARPGGAERHDYERAGVGYGPRNGPFESIAEVRQVLGAGTMSQELLEKLTVYSHLKQSVAATPEVSSDQAPSLVGEVVRARACANRQGFTRCRKAIVRITGRPDAPLQVFLWETQS